MSVAAGFTERIRQELAGLELSDDDEVGAELTALLRFSGTLTLTGGDSQTIRVAIETGSGAVARRAYLLVAHRFGLRPQLSVRLPGGLRSQRTYRTSIEVGSWQVMEALGLVDAHGRPSQGPPPAGAGPVAIAYLRGALLATGSVSSPGRDPHLEIVAGSTTAAEDLAALAGRVIGRGPHVTDEPRPRVVIKSGERIGELLAAVGATQAFLSWDDQRLRRQLRGEATRLANADSANLRRSIDASSAQVAAVERAIATVGWEGLDEQLRDVALARL
ncbi:MAG: DNA-binding protein WhiA, partial [Actinomycetota bacterium]